MLATQAGVWITHPDITGGTELKIVVTGGNSADDHQRQRPHNLPNQTH